MQVRFVIAQLKDEIFGIGRVYAAETIEQGG